MKITEIVLENFRGFNQLQLRFCGKNVVLVGTNGVGKSTILNAAIIVLSRFVEVLSYGISKKISLSETDIKNGNQGLKIKCSLTYDGHVGELELTKIKATEAGSKLVVKDTTKEIISHLHKKLAEDESFNAPIFVNYPVHRNVKDIPEKIKARKGLDPYSAYHQCFSRDVDFGSFFEWFLQQSQIESLRAGTDSISQEEDAAKPLQSAPASLEPSWENQLNAVRKAIYNFLPGFSDLKVLRNGKARVIVTKGKQCLEVNQLSNGEKVTLAMIGDLARRLALANPSLENPLEGEGIVLIDEIELHLHPAWQREIINLLQSTFPNIQFILSTHSPQVLGELSDAEIFFVTQEEDGEEIKVRSVPSLFGKDSNMILEQFMGVAEKNEEIKYMLQKLFRYIMESKLVEAKRMQEQLVEILGSDDPNLVKADMIIRRKESLGQ
ncbi:AAA family ATPase [Bacillus sp. T3]|uniref:AAA family ATPase n=1 Tax=Bacillus sp. T3 TaxID=467262 RepID=UPI002982A61D|nr:AAA family ATPase [Bacillus sp. T3]